MRRGESKAWSKILEFYIVSSVCMYIKGQVEDVGFG